MVPRAYPVGTGWIEVITGCMFSGKTEELIRRLNRARYATEGVVMFKPSVDTRYSTADVVSHSELRFPSHPVDHASDILRMVDDAVVVGIDEAQFFDRDLIDVVTRLAEERRRVVVAGLDLDYRGVPFEPMPELMATAEYVTKTLAVCVVCGAPASRTQRLARTEARILLGATESYEARCRLHWDPTAFDETQQSLPLERSS